MNATETAQPPRAPRASDGHVVEVGLWVAYSPDPRLSGTRIAPGPTGEVTLGRGAEATHPIDDRWLSRVHLKAARSPGGEWSVEDLDTRNGTFVNRSRVPRATLRCGDVVRLGATLLVADRGVPPEDDLGIVGRSAALSRIRRAVGECARAGQPVHVTGPTGAGKEMVARALHLASGRRGELLAVNMATVTRDLAESQLFGHRRGAFTGAAADHVGAFDAASGRTLLLDEIGELPLELQGKLLRVVETGDVHRLGDSAPHRVDVQLVTATHRDLPALVAAEAFREDLYFRIAQTVIVVPPLAERRIDIVPLVDHFVTAGGRTLRELSTATEEAPWHTAELLEPLMAYGWPGNVRELRSEIARATASGGVTGAASRLSAQILSARAAVAEAPPVRSATEAARYEALLTDPAALVAAIRTETGGRIKAFAESAAAALGKPWRTVHRDVYRILTADDLKSLRDK